MRECEEACKELCHEQFKRRHACLQISRCTDDLEAAMKSAAQDASAEARASARTAYANYAKLLPEAAHSFLRKLEPFLQDKLCKGGAAGGGREAPASRRGE